MNEKNFLSFADNFDVQWSTSTVKSISSDIQNDAWAFLYIRQICMGKPNGEKTRCVTGRSLHVRRHIGLDVVPDEIGREREWDQLEACEYPWMVVCVVLRRGGIARICISRLFCDQRMRGGGITVLRSSRAWSICAQKTCSTCSDPLFRFVYGHTV